MIFFYTRRKYRKEPGSHDYKFRHFNVMGSNIWSFFRRTKFMFEVDVSKQGEHPCNDKGYKTFDPNAYKVNGEKFYDWLRTGHLKGKIRVDYYFSAWYSTFLHDPPDAGIHEQGIVRISFSDKSSAMAFKLAFAGPELQRRFSI